MIEQIKSKVFSLKIKVDIKEHLSEDEISFLNTTDDAEILEKVNAFVVSGIEDYDVTDVKNRFFSDLPKFESYQECLEYYLEKDEFLNGPNKSDRVDDFIKALQDDRLFVNMVKKIHDDNIESELI